MCKHNELLSSVQCLQLKLARIVSFLSYFFFLLTSRRHLIRVVARCVTANTFEFKWTHKFILVAIKWIFILKSIPFNCWLLNCYHCKTLNNTKELYRNCGNHIAIITFRLKHFAWKKPWFMSGKFCQNKNVN